MKRKCRLPFHVEPFQRPGVPRPKINVAGRRGKRGLDSFLIMTYVSILVELFS